MKFSHQRFTKTYVCTFFVSASTMKFLPSSSTNCVKLSVQTTSRTSVMLAPSGRKKYFWNSLSVQRLDNRRSGSSAISSAVWGRDKVSMQHTHLPFSFKATFKTILYGLCSRMFSV